MNAHAIPEIRPNGVDETGCQWQQLPETGQYVFDASNLEPDDGGRECTLTRGARTLPRTGSTPLQVSDAGNASGGRVRGARTLLVVTS